MKRMVFAAAAMSVGMAMFGVAPLSAQRHAPPGAPDLGPAVPRDYCRSDFERDKAVLYAQRAMGFISAERYEAGIAALEARRADCYAAR